MPRQLLRDGRIVADDWTYLTEAGNALLAKAFEIAMAHEKWTCEPLTDAERDQLIGLLERIGRHLGLSPGAHSALRDNHEPPAS